MNETKNEDNNSFASIFVHMICVSFDGMDRRASRSRVAGLKYRNTQTDSRDPCYSIQSLRPWGLLYRTHPANTIKKWERNTSNFLVRSVRLLHSDAFWAIFIFLGWSRSYKENRLGRDDVMTGDHCDEMWYVSFLSRNRTCDTRNATIFNVRPRNVDIYSLGNKICM